MSQRVLVVDDSLTVRMDLEEGFTEAGFDVALAATLAEARRALGAEAFPIVVIDILLPDGDGIDLLREIRRTAGAGATKVILLSTEAEVAERVRGIATGADAYVDKPYERSFIVTRVKELLRRSVTVVDARTRILLVDDSPTFRAALRESLEEAGYAVLEAESGEEGLRRAAEERPDAVVVDGNMPGIDGATVIRRIRLDVTLRRTPCIMLTGSDENGAELRALDAGADAFLRKEEDIDVALARIGAVLRTAATPDRELPEVLLGPKKILAVDDSRTYLNEVSAALREEGYEVVPAKTGEEALELLAVESFECILLDLVMPGIGGTETCRRIKAAPKIRETPLIMLTSIDDRDAMLAGLGAGADDYIAKGADFHVLKARVAAQIRRKQFEDENRHIREKLLQSELEAQEARAARELAEARALLLADLERKNEELEAFAYSVSHDLRAPLRGIDGLSRILIEDYADKIDEQGRGYLERVRTAAQHMDHLIQDLLALSRVGRLTFEKRRVDMSALARQVVERLRTADPGRVIDVVIDEDLVVEADSGLLEIALENLIGNAWKFTGKKDAPRIEIGRGPSSADQPSSYFVRDNGAGFDMAYAQKLFGVFQRLHQAKEFEGTGIGLATVQRIVSRHGGRIWAASSLGSGATFSFTLGEE